MGPDGGSTWKGQRHQYAQGVEWVPRNVSPRDALPWVLGKTFIFSEPQFPLPEIV